MLCQSWVTHIQAPFSSYSELMGTQKAKHFWCITGHLHAHNKRLCPSQQTLEGCCISSQSRVLLHSDRNLEQVRQQVWQQTWQHQQQPQQHSSPLFQDVVVASSAHQQLAFPKQPSNGWLLRLPSPATTQHAGAVGSPTGIHS